MGRYIVDFYCPAARLAIELDGDTHAGRETYDANRTAWLQDRGVRAIRFTNADIHHHLDEVLRQISEIVNPANEASQINEA